MEGLFQIVVVLVFVVVSILDGISRKKRQEEQKERMRRNETAEEGVLVGDSRDVFDDVFALEAEADELDRAASGPRGHGGQGTERETADQMIPEDLWAILTGQKPLPGTPPAPTAPEPAPAPQWESEPARAPMRTEEEGPWWSWGRGEDEGVAPEPPPVVRPEAPAPSRASRTATEGGTRRSARWMEGLDREPSELRAPSRPVPDGLDASAAWSAYLDISTGEIGSADEMGVRYDDEAADASGSARPTGRRTTASRYATLLTSGQQEDLRSAIVLREVLGPPVGQRDRNWE